ncbi:MAG: DUF4340 domain-containing protein [Caldilineaceae bacterium]
MSEATQTMPTPVLTRGGLSKMNLILIGLLLVQVVIAALVFWPRGGVTEGTPLLGALTVDQITKVTISDNADATVTLEKSDGQWTLANTDGYPAKGTDIDTALGKLIALTTNRLVTRTPASHQRLQVAADDFVRKVELTTGDGVKTLYIGSSPASGATHVRLDGQDETYLGSDINSWEWAAQASNWIDAQYFTVTSNDVDRIALQNANGELVFTRGEANADGTPGEWSMEGLADGEQLDTSKITTLLTRISSVRLVNPLGKTDKPEYGLGEPQATVTLETKDAEGTVKNYTLQLGAKDGQNNYAFKSSDSEYYVQIAAFTGDDLVKEARADYIKQPESSVPADAAPAAPAVQNGNGVTSTGILTSTGAITATNAVTSTEVVSDTSTP